MLKKVLLLKVVPFYRYLNEELVVTKGPSNNPDELLFHETDLKSKSLGFNVGRYAMNGVIHSSV